MIDEFKLDPLDQNIFYCHSGVRSTTAIYDGSWLEWSYYERNPVARGR